jgi:translocation and assembly module TamA
MNFSVRIGLCNLTLIGFFMNALAYAEAPSPTPSINTTKNPDAMFPVSVTVTGLPESIQAEILQVIPLKEKSNLTRIQARLLYQQSFSEIHEALKPLGYYQSEITGNLSKENAAIFNVNLGTPITLKSVDISIQGEGENDTVFQKAIKASKLAPGIILKHAQYQTLKEQLLNIATQRGYFDAKFEKSEIQLQLNQNEANIVIHFDTGIRYHFGGVTFEQNGYQFKNSFLQRFLPFSRREYYTANQMNLLQTQLNDSGYFKSVYLESEQDAKNHLLNINAKTTPLPAYEYVIGPGYGTDTGPRILLGFKARHLTEDGQKLSIQSQFSSAYQNITADYTIPGPNPVTDRFEILVGQNYTDISAYYSRDTFFGAEWSSTHGRSSRTIGLKRHFILYTPENQASLYGTYLVPSFNYSYLDEIEAGYFKKGFLLSATIQGATDHLFSETSFIQGLANTKISIPFTRSARILLSGQVGALKASNFDDLATPYRFYAGGLDSVLGYSYYSLSPSNSSGLTGGKALLTAFAGVEKRLYKKLSGIAFFNTGNAFNNFNDMKLQHAAGLGLAYRSLVGPITLYLAKPVGSSTQQGLAFNFSIGAYLS